MQKLLLESGNLGDAHSIKKDFEKELPFELLLSANSSETKKILANKSVQLIIKQSREFQQINIDSVHALRRSGYTYPVLFILDKINSLARQFEVEEEKAHLLEKPFELKTLRGVVRKLMTSRAISKQQYKRFRTNQNVSLETFISGENVHTKMFNLSKGGAYFEVSKKPGLGVGELLRLHFQLEQVEKEHQIHGRIVWTTPKGHISGGYGLGVKFIKSQDIYRHLLQVV